MEDCFQLAKNRKIGVYCHIPFCIKKCAYCDFNSWVCRDENNINAYFEALKNEVLLVTKNQRIAVDSIYLGGGTPSAVAAIKIKELMTLLRNQFNLSKKAEITIEINPGTVTEEKLFLYKEAGINRVSVGLQAWQNELLKVLGRAHDQKDFIQTMAALKKIGFTNKSVDLMYGIPGQTVEMIKETLAAVVEIKPTHFSCYSLILEAGTGLTQKVKQGLLELPAEEKEREMHWLIHEYLEKNDYRHYEISSYAKKGYESQHNLKYWQMNPYLGFGLGAHSFYQGVRYGNESHYKKYLELIQAGQEPSHKNPPLTKKEWMKDWMLLGLRKLEGIDNREFQKQFQLDFFKLYKKEITELIDRKLLLRESHYLRLTAHGQDFANQVFVFFV